MLKTVTNFVCLKFSAHVENCNACSKLCWIFQGVLKTCWKFQGMLKTIICVENYVETACWKFQHVLKTVTHVESYVKISRCVENVYVRHVENHIENRVEVQKKTITLYGTCWNWAADFIFLLRFCMCNWSETYAQFPCQIVCTIKQIHSLITLGTALWLILEPDRPPSIGPVQIPLKKRLLQTFLQSWQLLVWMTKVKEEVPSIVSPDLPFNLPRGAIFWSPAKPPPYHASGSKSTLYTTIHFHQ